MRVPPLRPPSVVTRRPPHNERDLSPPAFARPCGECPGCAGGTCEALAPRPVWTRWKDLDPRPFAFKVGALLTREWHGRRWNVQVVRVRWNAAGGRLEPLPFEPPALRARVTEGRGWWAWVAEPMEPQP